MMQPIVMGLDPSLAGTGVATRVSCWTHKTKGQKGDSYEERGRRIRMVGDWIAAQVHEVGPDLVCLEGPSYASASTTAFDRAKLWWDVYQDLADSAVPTAVIAPNSRAKYATGSGRANKQQVILAAGKRLSPMLPITNDNEADACWLMAMGYDWLGAPLVDVPKVNGDALKGVDWPERAGGLLPEAAGV
jgi:Holliday junction resolvasome RuvABC endonuclease subunit